MDPDHPMELDRALSRGEIIDSLARMLSGEIDERGVTGTDRILLLPCPPTVLEIGLTHTREVGTTDLFARASWPLQAGPTFDFVDEGGLRSWLSRLSSPGIRIGHAGFDEQFEVRGRADESAELVLRAAADPLLLRAPTLFRSTPRSFRLSWNLELSPTVRWLVEAVSVARAVATADLYGTPALRALPGASLDLGSESVLPTARVQRPTPIWLRTERREDALTTVAWTSDRRGTADAPPDLAQLAGDEAALAHRSQATRLHFESSTIYLQWGRICRDTGALDAGARLLAVLSTPSTGVYR